MPFMQTQITRTTINLDLNLHRQLTYEAASLGLSLSQLVNTRLLNNNMTKTKTAGQKAFDADWNFFRQMNQKAKKVNWAKALREERDRDNG